MKKILKMNSLLNKGYFRKWQAVIAVLLFLFFASVSWASFQDELESGRPLPEVIEYALDYGMTVQTLVDELVAANKEGSEIICGLFIAGVEPYKAVEAALNSGLDPNEVAQWALDCGASMENVQMGFSMAGEKLPPGFVFQQAEEFEDNAKEYLYNPPSQSK
jgi:hypothetical protein